MNRPGYCKLTKEAQNRYTQAAMNVSVFGGSQTRPGEADYDAARYLGRLLAESGCTVLTGGYMGAMEAVSRGAHEVGGHVIGVTCEEIERWRPVGANRWVKEEYRCKTLLERMQALVSECDAAIALPGGPGTLAEVVLLWNLMIVQTIAEKPFILVGSGWKTVMETFHDEFDAYCPSRQRRLLRFAPTVSAAVSMLPIPR